MSRHARSARGFAGESASGHRAGRGIGRAPRIVAALCGTALVAGTGGLLGGALGGVLPPPSGAPASLTAQDPATAVPAADTVRVSAAALRLAPAVDARVAETQQQILTLVNTRRAEHGCGALSASAQLNQLAVDYSAEMGTENFFSHTDPAGRTPWDRARAMGIANLGGENIAVGQPTPQAVMDAWMHSSGHRANILDCRFHSLGVGVYYAEGGPWWTQDFGY